MSSFATCLFRNRPSRYETAEQFAPFRHLFNSQPPFPLVKPLNSLSRFAVTLPFVVPLTEQLAKRERNFTVVFRLVETVRPPSSLASKSGVRGHHVRLWLQSVECRTVQWAPRSSLASKRGVPYSTVGTTFVFGFKEWSAVQYSGHHVRLWLQRVECCTVQWAPRSSLASKSGVLYSTVGTTFPKDTLVPRLSLTGNVDKITLAVAIE